MGCLRLKMLSSMEVKNGWCVTKCDFDLQTKTTHFNSVRANVAKTASKSMHPFGWNFVQLQTDSYTQRQAAVKIITPPRFREDVITSVWIPHRSTCQYNVVFIVALDCVILVFPGQRYSPTVRVLLINIHNSRLILLTNVLYFFVRQ